jgi:site-specific DNA-methyltransferase (adenine-specific)
VDYGITLEHDRGGFFWRASPYPVPFPGPLERAKNISTPAQTAAKKCKRPQTSGQTPNRLKSMTVEWNPSGPDLVIEGDNLEVLRQLPDASFQMIYIDPPFNTGKTQKLQSLKTRRSETGNRLGFKGQSYETVKGQLKSYDDSFDDYWLFLEPRLEEAWRLLKPTGTLYLHLDYREVHYAKVLLDALFGRECFLNEIIWAYDYGARSKSKWPTKHDNILVYVKDFENYYFNSAEVDREPYMAPGLVTPEKAALGKLPTDVWWHTIVSPTGKEKTGYPTQKPLGILRRMIAASSAPGDWILDFFAGSGTAGAAARGLDRRFVLVDRNPEAIQVMRTRLESDLTASTAFINEANQ